MENIIVNVATEFTTSPWARYYTDWTFSWEEFFEKILLGKMKEAIDLNVNLEINFDWVNWPPSSFLSESFWRLNKEYPNDFAKRLIITGSLDPSLRQIIDYHVSQYEK